MVLNWLVAELMKRGLTERYFGCYVCDFPGGSEVKASAWDVGDLGLIPGSGRSPGEGNGNPLQYSCLDNPMDRGAWSATVHGAAKSQTRLSNFTTTTSKCLVDWTILIILDLYTA